MLFSHCLPTAQLRSSLQARSENYGIIAVWGIRQQEMQKYCCVNPSWLGTLRREHKVVTSRDLGRLGRPEGGITTDLTDRPRPRNWR